MVLEGITIGCDAHLVKLDHNSWDERPVLVGPLMEQRSHLAGGAKSGLPYLCFRIRSGVRHRVQEDGQLAVANHRPCIRRSLRLECGGLPQSVGSAGEMTPADGPAKAGHDC